MRRAGFTLAELLVALAVFAIVGSGAFYLFSSQNRAWKLDLDRNAIEMVGKGTLDELDKAVRTAGGGVPDSMGGIRVWSSSIAAPKVTFVSNLGGGVDSSRGFLYEPASGGRRLCIRVDSAEHFEDAGYVRLNLLAPADGNHASNGLKDPAPYTLKVLDRVGGCGSDSVYLDARPLVAAPHSWNQAGDIRVPVPTMMVNIDSNTFRKSKDTLYQRRNSLDECVLATGIDTLRFWYHHPVAGWLTSLSSVAPAKVVDKIRIRLVMRTSSVDPVLLRKDPASRGYHLLRMETEVIPRTTTLVNQ